MPRQPALQDGADPTFSARVQPISDAAELETSMGSFFFLGVYL